MLTLKLSFTVFLDVNLRKPWWDAKQVKALVRAATWLKLNDSELDTLFPGREKMAARCRDLLHRFDLDAVFITLGAKGAVALKRDNVFVSARPQEKISIIDTVGAGDAFSAVLLLGLVKGWPLDTAMQRAQDFASAVVGLRGAVSREKEFYQTFKENWDLA
ncbi:MAG: carbohydrate kinase family protein [Desulfobulbales bacterium]|nr:carbohydrate kinase family protein [Desulfobulbales bacterium]